jgi:dephospho-CoA kinase
MLRVGITGGIGSGKTTVCEIFHHLGIPIFYADQQAKRLYSENSELKNQLIEHFGIETYVGPNEINLPFFKTLLASPEKREILNSLVHPFVFKQFDDWVNQQKSAYIIKEAAILFESGAHKTVHKTIAVIASENVRIERVKQRDPHRSLEEIQRIIQSQLSNEELQNRADYLILNDGSQSLIEQVRNLHQILLNESRHF